MRRCSGIKGSERKHRVFLTIVFSALTLMIFVITMLIVGALILLSVRSGLFGTRDYGSGAVVIILLFVPSSICVGTFVSAIISHFPLRPVYKIINGMNGLASGNYDTRIDLGKTEMGKEVTESFNKLAAELQNTEMLRSDFINNFSHEFKTPIVSICGFARLLKRDNLTESQRLEYLNIIEEESARLSSMATNVLNLTKVENQSILTNVTSYNLSEQIRTCLLLLEKKWSAKNLKIGAEFNEHTIKAEEELLKQVWINLIDNAVKFSPDNGEVEITMSEEGENIVVSVKNYGSHIGSEDRARIFNKFYQADSSHSSQGNGLGLSIAKRIVDLHKGDIVVKSENGCTTFSVSLPKNNE